MSTDKLTIPTTIKIVDKLKLNLFYEKTDTFKLFRIPAFSALLLATEKCAHLSMTLNDSL